MQLYTIFNKKVYNTCFRILHNSFEAENAMQESLLKVLSNLDSYNNTVPLEAWIVRIAINTSIDKLRKKNLLLVELNENIDHGIYDEDEEKDWDDIIGKVEQIKTAIHKLPDPGRLIITLYLIEGYDHEEIGEILNIPAGTSRIQYMRAKQKLIQLL